MLFCSASVFSEWSFTPLLAVHSMASFQCENSPLFWGGLVIIFFFRFSAYHSNRLCYGFPFNLLWLLSFREFLEVLRYEKGCIISSNMSHLSFCMLIWFFSTNLEFPGNPLENHILLATFLPPAANFTWEVTHHLRFQQFQLEHL